MYFADDFLRILFSIQLLTGLLQGIVAITTAAFSCRAVCCGGQRSNMVGPVVYTNAVSEQVSALPLATVIATAAPAATMEGRPPKYEGLETNQDPGGGDQYQRFH